MNEKKLCVKDEKNLRDYKGQRLCTHCWHNYHWCTTGKGKNARKKSVCLDGGCECHCREMLAEKPRRAK